MQTNLCLIAMSAVLLAAQPGAAASAHPGPRHSSAGQPRTTTEASERHAMAALLLRIEAEKRALDSRADAEFRAAGCDDFPSPDQLAAPGGLATQKQVVNNCRLILIRQRGLALGLFSEALGWIGAADLPAGLKRELHTTFEQTFPTARAHLERVYATVAREYQLEADLLDFLELQRGHWAVQNGDLAFDSDELIAEYRRRAGAVQSVGDELEADIQAQEENRRRLEAAAREIDPSLRHDAPAADPPLHDAMILEGSDETGSSDP